MVLWAYFDESGEHQPKTGKLCRLTIGGGLSTLENWQRVEREWRAALHGEAVSVFHMTDFEANRGQFAGWDKAKHQRLLAKLLSCSLSRVRARLFVSAGAEGAGSGVRTAGDRIRRRRFNKLSCAGWLPHDRGFVSELPRSRSERRLRPAHNRSRGFPTAILSPAARTIGFASVDPLSPLSADGLIRRAAAAARSGQSPR